MYQVYSDNTLIFSDSSPESTLALGDPKLSLDSDSAGNLSFTAFPGTVAYDSDTVKRVISTIYVKRDNKTLWIGRPMRERKNFYNEREITCEGALAFLNDTLQNGSYSGAPGTVLSTLLTNHNNKVSPNRQILLGNVTISGTVQSFDAKFEKTYDVINNKLVGELGGILRVRYETSGIYLDWLANYPQSNPNNPPQTIEFGKNLLDFSRNWDMNEFVTVVYARGAKIEPEEGQEDAPEQYHDIGYVYDQSTVDAYGWIATFIEYSDIEDETELRTEALRYLSDHQFDEMELELSAVDLHIINPSIKPFDLFDLVHVISNPHALGINRQFSILSIEIPLDKPENTSYKFGDAQVAYKRRVHTLTKKQRQERQEIDDRIEEEHELTESSLSDLKEYTEQGLEDANTYADNAAAVAGQNAIQVSAEAMETVRQGIINSIESMTEGYVFIDYNSSGTQGIYITSSPITSASQLNSCANSWRWTSGGLAHYKYNQLDGVALSYDGKINADMILTGHLLVDMITLYGDMAVYPSSSGGFAGGFIGYGTGNNGYDQTAGIHMYTGYGNEIIVTGYGARMSFDGTSFYLNGVAAYSTCDINAPNFFMTSDRNAKKNIEYDPQKYELIFDLLRPCSFEYKKNNPDIRHTGFIAQDVEDSLEEAGLTANDFGCLHKDEIYDPMTKETHTEYSLQYNDLISLCVHQIQLLKKRVSDLEAKING